MTHEGVVVCGNEWPSASWERIEKRTGQDGRHFRERHWRGQPAATSRRRGGSLLRPLEDGEGGPVLERRGGATRGRLDRHQLPPFLAQHVQAAIRRVPPPLGELQGLEV